MITETNAFHPTSKAAVAEALAGLGVELSASRVKKTSLTDLIRMLDEANAKPKKTRAGHRAARKWRKGLNPA